MNLTDLFGIWTDISKKFSREHVSKHAAGRYRDLTAYRLKRNRKNKIARSMRAIQHRRDRQSSKRQRSGR